MIMIGTIMRTLTIKIIVDTGKVIMFILNIPTSLKTIGFLQN